MSCHCHITPPCSCCVETYECVGCGLICHPEEDGENLHGVNTFCNKCFDELNFEDEDDL